MPKHTLTPYQCPRCGYKTDRKSCVQAHFNNKKKPCPAIVRNIDIDPEVIEYVLANRIYPEQKDNTNSQSKTIIALQKELMFHNNRKDEKFFHTVLEDCLDGSHKKLQVGVTDITTDTFHAEIKDWKDWQNAIGNLMSYNDEDPKEQLHIYLFGRCGDNIKEAACKTLGRLNIKPFECILVEDGVNVIDLKTKTSVLKYKMIGEVPEGSY